MLDTTTEALLERLTREGARLTPSEGMPGGQVLYLPKAQFLAGMRRLKDEGGFDSLVYLTAADWLEKRQEFELTYILESLRPPRRLCVRAAVDRHQPYLPSVTPLWPSANFYERELFDLFGLRFEGHPDLRRLLMPEDWIGHPLRKDYPLTEEPVHFLDRTAPRLPSELIPKKYVITAAQKPAAPAAPTSKSAGRDPHADRSA